MKFSVSDFCSRPLAVGSISGLLLCLLMEVASGADHGLENYDEAADIAALAVLDNQRMHFSVILPQVGDKSALWAGYEEELKGIQETDYQRLKPLIIEKSVAEIQTAVAAGQYNYEQLLLFYLYRLREIETDPNRFLNAVIGINPQALQVARARDRERQAGKRVSPDSLFGIPVLLKDNIGLAGMPTTAGAVALQANQTRNAFVTDKLQDAGAVIIGKANLSEWAYFFCRNCPSGYSAIGGQTLNPYGRMQFGTGGSSSGSGAATAANLATLAVGSETSGSILSPASANSLVGLKPTTGNLSRSGVVPISSTLDTVGPMTRSVADTVILFNAMAGFDPGDKAMPLLAQGFQLQLREINLQDKRLGVIDGFTDDSHYQVAVELLENNGASLLPVDLNPPGFPRFTQFLGVEMRRDLPLYLDTYAHEEVVVDSVASVKGFNEEDMARRAPYGQGLMEMMAELELTAEEAEALRIELQDQARGYLDGLFAEQSLSVLLSMNNRNAGLAALANYPALTIPMGYESDGRPVGLTLIAPPFMEQELIDIGYQFEKLSGVRQAPDNYR